MSYQLMDNLFQLDSTQRLTLKLISLRDIEEVRFLHNDPSVLSNLTNPTEVSEQMQLNWFNAVEDSQTSYRYVCRHKKTNQLVGVFRIDNLEPLNRSAMIGLDISKEFRRQGYAYEIYQYMIAYFFNIKKYNRLYLSTLESNFQAINLYKKLGFQIEGRQIKSINRDGKLLDLICYYKINENTRIQI